MAVEPNQRSVAKCFCIDCTSTCISKQPYPKIYAQTAMYAVTKRGRSHVCVGSLLLLRNNSKWKFYSKGFASVPLYSFALTARTVYRQMGSLLPHEVISASSGSHSWYFSRSHCRSFFVEATAEFLFTSFQVQTKSHL
jgi:hypothetical protein